MNSTREVLLGQFEIAWTLTLYHLDGITDEEVMWRPHNVGPHVHRTSSKSWIADWPTDESYSLGAPSGAWIMWHMIYWWSMVNNYSFGSADLTRDKIHWPGDASLARQIIVDLRHKWLGNLSSIDDLTFVSRELSRWPKLGCEFTDIVAWVNLEFMKNASELGYCRFLFATKIS